MSLTLPPATAITILAVALLLLFTPLWTHFAIGSSGGGTFLATPDMANQVSDKTIRELFFGPGTFSYSTAPGPVVFSAEEAAHLRDVRVVLFAFLGLASLSAASIAFALFRHGKEAATWRGIRHGAVSLAILLAVLGVIGVLAFGLAFELFHRLLFPGGNWAFPPDSNLIRLYPYAFWQLSAAALGVLSFAGAGIVWFVARRRAAKLAAQ